jgi:hypothetical protein
MQVQKTVAGILLASWMAAAQTASSGNPPQAAWTPAPRQGVAGGMSEAQIARSVENYRQMWRKMKPAQQKQMLQMGGATPEQYERMLRGGLAGGTPHAGSAPADKSTAPDYNRGADAGALDSLGQSLIDLNAIRDANVARLQKDGCPPEVAARIADLRGRLARMEGESNGHGEPAQSAAAARRTSGAVALDVAANWFKADDRTETGGDAGAGPSPSTLLDSVLPEGDGSRPKPRPGDEAARRRTQEAGMAQIKAELAQLQGTCLAVKP